MAPQPQLFRWTASSRKVHLLPGTVTGDCYRVGSGLLLTSIARSVADYPPRSARGAIEHGGMDDELRERIARVLADYEGPEKLLSER